MASLYIVLFKVIFGKETILEKLLTIVAAFTVLNQKLLEAHFYADLCAEVRNGGGVKSPFLLRRRRRAITMSARDSNGGGG